VHPFGRYCILEAMEAMLDIAARHPVASPVPGHSRLAPVPALLGLAGAVAVVLAGCGAGAGRGPQRVPVAVAQVESRSVPYEIEATGTVEPLQSAEVTAQAGGLITRVLIREGAEVAQGQPLFQIDPRPYEAARAEAAAALARARAQAETARLDAEHAEALAAQQLVSPDELRTKRSASVAMAATVSADSAALMNADLDLEHAMVRAPIGGRTGSLAVHEGDLVRANDVTTPLVSINRLRPIRVRFTVSQADLPEIRRARGGPAARVDIAASETDSTWITGALAFVDNAVDQASGTLLLKAETANRDGALWPGQFVRVRLRLYDQAGAVVVPAAAVTSSQKGPYCYVVAPDTTVEMRSVTVQRTWRDLAVIASGLKSGETVVTDGQLRLSPGARAVIRNPAGAASAAAPMAPPAGGRGGGDGGGSADGRERAAKRDPKGGGK
jgi:multidrug efflux system membrane fusion protein